MGRGGDTAASGQGLPLHHPPDQPPGRGSPWRLPLALGNSLEWEPILLSGSQFSIQETTSILLNLTTAAAGSYRGTSIALYRPSVVLQTWYIFFSVVTFTRELCQ